MANHLPFGLPDEGPDILVFAPTLGTIRMTSPGAVASWMRLPDWFCGSLPARVIRTTAPGHGCSSVQSCPFSLVHAEHLVNGMGNGTPVLDTMRIASTESASRGSCDRLADPVRSKRLGWRLAASCKLLRDALDSGNENLSPRAVPVSGTENVKGADVLATAALDASLFCVRFDRMPPSGSVTASIQKAMRLASAGQWDCGNC